MWFVVLLLLPFIGRAEVFASCENGRFQPRFDMPSRGRCTTFGRALDTLSPLTRHEVQQHDVDEAARQFTPKVLNEVDRAIAARERLIGCLDQPATTGCPERMANLRQNLAHHITKYRAALALAGRANSPSAAVDALDPNLHALAILGGRPLTPLTSEEYWRLRKLHDEILAAEDRFPGRDAEGRPMNKDKFIAQCESHSSEAACIEYTAYKENARMTLNGVETIVASQRYAQALDQFESGESDRLVRTTELRNAHDDFLVNVAFTGVQSLPLTQTAKVITKGSIGAEDGTEQLRMLIDNRQPLSEDEQLDQALDRLEAP